MATTKEEKRRIQGEIKKMNGYTRLTNRAGTYTMGLRL